ncbi:MAG: polymer-forming cytoskeletal protein [Thermoplasmata archaeon]
MALSLPWLLLLGLFLPIVLTAPLLIEHARNRDVGPRVVPTTTLDPKRRTVKTAGSKRSFEEPKVMPGLTRIPLDLEVLEGVELEGNVVTEGALTISKGGALRGSAKAMKGVLVDEEAKVYGNLISAGDVELGRLSSVQGLVYTAGNVTLRPGAVVKGIYADGRVDIYPGAEILEDVIAGEGVHLVVPVDGSRALEELESLNALLSPDKLGRDTEGEG